MYYLIKESLTKCSAKDLFRDGAPYVAVITPEEWKKNRELFAMGIDIDEEPASEAITRAVVNYDSLTGSISIPRMGYDDHEAGYFNFALDEKGIVFIDREDLAAHLTEAVGESRRWRMPSLGTPALVNFDCACSTPIFSFKVMRQSASSMRSSIGTFTSRYFGVGWAVIAIVVKTMPPIIKSLLIIVL